MKMILLVAIFTALCGIGSAYDITNQAVLLEEQPGGNVVLECTVEGDDFNPFDHTLEFRKKQLQSDTRGEQVAVFKNLKGVFATEGRFSVTQERKTSPLAQEKFTLTINGLTHEDSGWYRCQIDDSGSITDSVEHRLRVYEPVESVVIYGYPTNPPPENETMTTETPSELSYQENQNGYFECRSRGGFPKPVLRVLINDTQITGSQRLQDQSPREPELVGDKEGLQDIVYTVRMTSTAFKPTARDDGSTLRCQSEISFGGKVVIEKFASTRLNIQGSPLFQDCRQEVKAQVGQENFLIQCNFIAKPQWESVTWHGITSMEDVNGASALPIQDPPGYEAYTVATPQENTYQAKLVIKEVKNSNFQSYKLTVANSIDSEEIIIRLTQGASSPDGPNTDDGSGGGAANANKSTIWWTALALLASLLATLRH